ncbi:hypothetical protein Spith_2184 [Spirochaeta thermophila DSM 6578]|uniref:Uncharacterized protein n=1 Tax=Winmispira thermophila (strain ATCC 700085 / DSM 6578 / Z-1203) TaxID=869211 RepID=G0GFP0_WINT7|nr:hypothetical protein [Spirochaeta thermophila]AEJ62439.1 hypothetical protein Spith_2184 [Spirochaeta thermophila DSM 6578]
MTADTNVPLPDSQQPPGFDELFGQGGGSAPTKRGFTIPKELVEAPKPFFKDPQYYQKVLSGEGEGAKRLHQSLAAFLNTEDPQERSIYRNRIITASWEVASSIAPKITRRDLPLPKRLFLRFGILLPTLLSEEQREMFSRVILDNTTGEPVHYVDEWLYKIGIGEIAPSAQDETLTAKKRQTERKKNILGELQGKLEAQKMVIMNKSFELEAQEQALQEQLRVMCAHGRDPSNQNALFPFTEAQKGAYTEVLNTLRRISQLDKELAREYAELKRITAHMEKARDAGMEEEEVDADVIRQEMSAVRQMAKLCVGRQGNHFPLAMRHYIRPRIEDVGIRERVLQILAEIEYLDPGAFERTYRQQVHRIVPHVILIPSYGERGICWEPFEKYNRGTSRGRIAIPMYPKDLRTAVIAAVGDLRWQVAKEKAQHYWMEEGLTGWYYQYFTDHKMKGDVKEQFIEDYILWITKESEGTQKLTREVRDIFWRYMPFPQEIKDKLKTRGFVYAELYKKDINRSLSDGY